MGKDLERMTDEYAKTEAALSEKTNKLNDIAKELADTEKELSRMKKEHEQTQHLIDEDNKVRQLIEARKKEIDLVEQKITERNEKLSALNEKLKILRKDDKQSAATLNKDIQDLLKKQEEYQNKLGALAKQHHGAEKKLDDMKLILSECEGKIEKAKVIEADMLEKLEKRRKELVESNSAIEEQKQAAQQKIHDLKDKKTDTGIYAAQKKELEKLLENYRMEKETLDQEISDKKQELQKIKLFLARLRDKRVDTKKSGKDEKISF
jgi:chromosome segregation ATPase